MGAAEMERIAAWMAEVAESPQDEARLGRIAGEVREVCQAVPAPGIIL
jgi:glycine hydroxymethyltransferase